MQPITAFASAAPGPASMADRGESGGPVPRRVLVVDDNRDAADSLALLLGLYGHEASVAYDGEEAIRMAHTLAPHIAFVDLGLPDCDGCEVARRIRKGQPSPEIVLVALTGYGRDSDRERSRDAGFDDHLVKPVNPQDLLALIERGRT